jgi:hypothetical protein
MRIKLEPANFFLNSVFFFLLMLFPFNIIRLYFYFNYFFSTNEFLVVDFLRLMITGLRFDLCVIGFLLLPSYLLYLMSYSEKWRQVSHWLNHLYKIITLVAIILVFHFNLPFVAVNLPFDIPYWMRWEDYQSLFFLSDCKVCFWDFDYMAQVYPIQIISGLMFIVVLFGSFSQWQYFSKEFSWRREFLFLVFIALMARGKLGEHHLRYEDSVWHKNPLVNELSNNPLWLIDKAKIYRRH